jgi:hypothetical protein
MVSPPSRSASGDDTAHRGGDGVAIPAAATAPSPRRRGSVLQSSLEIAFSCGFLALEGSQETSYADEKTLDPSRDIMGISNLLHRSLTPRLGPGLPPMNAKTKTKSWKKETNPADHGTKSKSRAIMINLENGRIGAQGENHRLHQLYSLRIQIHSASDLKYLYHNLLVPYLELRHQGRTSHPNLDYYLSFVLDLERLLPSNLPITGLIQVQIKVRGLHVSQNLSRRKRPFYLDLRQRGWNGESRRKWPTRYMSSWSMSGRLDWKGGGQVVCKGKGDLTMWGKARMVKQSVPRSLPLVRQHEELHVSTYISRHNDGADSLVVQCYRCLGRHRSPLTSTRIRLLGLDRGYLPPLWIRIHHMSYVSQICPSFSLKPAQC